MKTHIAQKVRSAMKEQKMTWRTLVEKSGVGSCKIINAILKGANYEIDSLVKVCDALKINLL